MRYTLFAQWIVQPIGWVVADRRDLGGRRRPPPRARARRSWHRGARRWRSRPAGWLRERRRLPHDVGGGRHRGGAHGRAAALRGAPGARDAVRPADLLHRLLRRVGDVLAPRRRRARTRWASTAACCGRRSRCSCSSTSVSLTFSPFVADLHHRGERERLDDLYKRVTRWALTATIPVLLVLAVLPGPVLRVFGEDFGAGADALRILIVGMIVPVMVGTVGFILIMAGRTGWDLVVYLGGFVIDVGSRARARAPGGARDPRRRDRAGLHAHVQRPRPAVPGAPVPGDLAVRDHVPAADRARRARAAPRCWRPTSSCPRRRGS